MELSHNENGKGKFISCENYDKLLKRECNLN